MEKVRQRFSLIVLLALLCSATAVSAQDYAFMVLGAKGGNTVDGDAVNVGATIDETQTLKVEENAYLGLAHTSGKTLEIKRAGTFKVADLVKKISTDSEGLADQYAAFVIDELTGGGKAKNRYAQRAKTGSVFRATPNAKPIQFEMPEKSDALPGEVTIRWYLNSEGDTGEDGKFKFTVKNISQETLMEKEVEGNKVTIDLKDGVLSDEKHLMYSVEAVSDNGLTSSDHMLVKVDGAKKNAVMKDLKEFDSEGTVFNLIAKAQVYEEKGLMGNAINAYEEAIEMDDSEQFKNLYKAFLFRNALSEEAREASLEK